MQKLFSPIKQWYQNKNDNFGFYQVGEFRTFSKLEAVEVSRRVNVPVYWNFNDPVFSSYDWTVEPAATLRDLYAARAHQLRDAYDYIVLPFSGGADSTTMLAAFIHNGIKVDEILLYVSEEGDHNKLSVFNIENTLAAEPYIEKHRHLMPDTKVTKIDISQFYEKTIRQDKIDLVYEHNALYTPNVSSRIFIRDHVPNWKPLFEAGKKVAFIWGHQKPMIRYHEGKYYYLIEDLIDFCVSPRQQQLNRDWEYNELFFSSPDCVPLVIKQAHTVKRFLNETTDITDLFSTRPSSFGSIFRNGTQYFLTMPGVNRVIYPSEWWNPLTFSKGKVRSRLFSPSDQWFLTQQTDGAKHFNKNLTAIKILFGNEWLDTQFEAVKTLPSKWYCLE